MTNGEENVNEKEHLGDRHSSVDDVPFSILADLYRDLRRAKIGGSKRGRGGRVNAESQRRRSLLTQTWLKIADLCGYGSEALAHRGADDAFIPAQVFPPEDSFKIICLLVPALDSQHSYLGMKESKLADAFIKALDLVSNGGDAQWLKHHKDKEYRPQRWQQNADIVDGNFATVLKAVLTDRCPSQSSLTVGAVWRALEDLSKVSRTRSIRISRNEHRYKAEESTARSAVADVSWRNPGDGEEDLRSVALRSLVQDGTSREIAEVARIILKDLDIRLSEDVFLSWFHPSAKQHYTQVHDIHQLLKDCANPSFEIGEASVQVGRYASVMLTMRPSNRRLDAICENLKGEGSYSSKRRKAGPSKAYPSSYQDNNAKPHFIMEPKLDGERMQLHKWKAEEPDDMGNAYEIKTFSRRGNDSSPMYAEALREVILSAVKAESIILDGEIMIWDNLRASWLRFEDMREVSTAIAKKSVPDGASYTLKYMVFDVLYVEQSHSKRSGNMVIRLPLYQRRNLLEELVTEVEAPYGTGARAKIEVVEKEFGHDDRELSNALQRYETLGYEGVIAKHPERPYVLGERNFDIAIKLKPDYFQGGIRDLDVLILGAKYSASRGHRTIRAGDLSTFLIGVKSDENNEPRWKRRDDEWEDEESKCKWVPVGSVGTGYSDKDLEELRNLLRNEWKPFDPKDLPDHFEKREYASTLLSEVAKWIEPAKSVVLTVRAYEVNRRFFALRFPRVEQINWTKPPRDVPTFSHLLDLDENKEPATVRPDEADVDDVSTMAVQKKTRSNLDVEEENAIMRVKEEGHVVTGGRNRRTVVASAVGADVSNIDQLSEALESLSFYVVCPDGDIKKNVEVQIHQLGGKFVQNLTSSVDFIIAPNFNATRVKKYKEQFQKTLGDEGTYPIVHSNWIEECMTKKQKVLPSVSDVFYATDKLEGELFAEADRFGDPWKRPTSANSLSDSLREVDKFLQSDIKRSRKGVARDIEEKVKRASAKSGNVFTDMVFLVPESEAKLSGSLALLKAYGATIIEHETEELTHVLLHSSVKETWDKKKISRPCEVVSEQWVRERLSRSMTS